MSAAEDRGVQVEARTDDSYLGALDPNRCAACLAYPSLPCAQHRGHAVAAFACDTCGARPATVGSAEMHERANPGHEVYEIEEADR